MINARSEKKTFYIKISKIVLLSAAILLIYMYYYANCHSRMYLTIFGLIAIGVITLIALALFKRITLESTKLFAAVLLISGLHTITQISYLVVRLITKTPCWKCGKLMLTCI